mgnify:CR=1 FL=1
MVIWIMKLILILIVILMILYNNANNWSTYTGDKINRQTGRHNNSFLDRINKKLESLKAIERSTTVERKNDRDNRIGCFLELYEKN